MKSNDEVTTKYDYYAVTNVRFLALLWAHIPITLFTAWATKQGHYGFALAMSLALVSLPTFLVWRARASLEASIANGVGLLSFSALLIHCSGGMTELHFHIFASLGLLITLAQPWAIVAALLVVVVHHVGFFFFLPQSLINYNASFSILVVHAVFALAIGVPAYFVSRKYKLYIVGVREIVTDLSGIADGIAESSERILEDSRLLSMASLSEAAAVTETSSSLQGLTSIIGKNSENANFVARMSDESKHKSSRGLDVVSRMVESLGEIRQNNSSVLTTVAKNNEKMERIINLIAAIESKTKVINDIVFQTKLLSFNASVEAARAGEHGKGFAVVAEEIGNLAQLSGTSAKEIRELLDTSTHDVREIINETRKEIGVLVESGQLKIEDGLRIADECKQALVEIDQSLVRVTTLAGEIAQASAAQTSGVSEISRAMSDIETTSQKNSSVSSRSTTSAGQIHDGAEKLNGAVNRLVRAVSDAKPSAA